MALQYSHDTSMSSYDEVYTKLQEYSFRIGEMVNQAKKFQIKKRDDVDTALVFASEARQLGKRIDEVRKEITEPARKFTSHINDAAKQFTEQLDKIEVEMILKVDDWKSLQRDKREVMELMEMESSVDVPSTIRAKGVTAYEKSSWKFEIQDIGNVPREYLMVNPKQVEHMLEIGVQDIPGLKVWKETKTILRTS